MLRFGEFTFDPSTGELRRNGSVARLEPQPARVLAVLVNRAGSLVTRAELREAVWLEGTHVEFDQGLNYCIRQIRVALGDDARRPMFVETAARRGYKFLPTVEAVTRPKRQRAVKMAAIAAGLAAALWLTERLEGAHDGAAHHEAAVHFLKALHDIVF
jgi:DNA-binding winged helix-turn-helix (wHTH) protein